MGQHLDRHRLAPLFVQFGPVIHLHDADSGGVSRGLIRRMFDRGELKRLAKGAFALTDTYDEALPWEQFRLRSIAVGLCAADDSYLTGAAAAAVWGLPMVSDPPELPVSLRPGNPHVGHDRSPHGRTRHGYLPAQHRYRHHRVRIVSPAFCAVDVARHFGPRDGLLVADKVLYSGVHREVLAALTGDMEFYAGISTARWVIEHADPRAESPLESLGHLAFLTAGLPAPISNAWIPVAGQWYRADHLLADTGVILEADGALKYNNRPDAAALISSDRNRERLLRGLSFSVERYTWGMAVNQPNAIVRRAQEAERLRAGMPAPTCWTLDPPF